MRHPGAFPEFYSDCAKQCNKDIPMLIDDAGGPNLKTLEMTAVRTIEVGRIGRSLAHHARAMALYDEPYFRKQPALLRS